MTREEVIELVCYGDWLNILMLHLGDDDINRLAEAMCIIGDALRPVSREQVERLRELVEADRDGRCVVLPAGGHTEKDGENALKSAMNTCFYHNNPVTRYIADAVAEKLTREADKAALRGDQHG